MSRRTKRRIRRIMRKFDRVAFKVVTIATLIALTSVFVYELEILILLDNLLGKIFG